MSSQHFVFNIHFLASICLGRWHLAEAYLLFPNNTVLQLTASISVPTSDLPSNRKTSWDWGFQMNYNMPYDPASFYNAPIWPTHGRAAGKDHKRILKNLGQQKHVFDFTAGELYSAIQHLMESFGYHSSCLLQSVCDLAEHPFDNENHHLFAELITFMLTPSWHLGFDLDENEQQAAYEAAEKSGTLSLDCKKLYPLCKKNVLEIITNVMFG